MKSFQYKSIIPVCFLALLTMFSCKKDLGNYDYHETFDMEIQGIEDSYNLVLGDTVSIIPNFSKVEGQQMDTAAFSYTWTVSDPRLVDLYRLRTISTSRNLEGVLPLSVGDYTIYYTVLDTLTRVSWIREFSVKVEGNIKPKGWFVLSEVNQQSRLDYFIEDLDALGTYPQKYFDFTKLLLDPNSGKQLMLTGKPKFINYFMNNVAAAESGYKAYLYIGTDEMTEKINISNGLIWKDILYQFKLETATGTYPETVDWVKSVTSATGYAFKGEELFVCDYAQRAKFGLSLNRLAVTSEPIKLHPSLAILDFLIPNAVGFDITKKRFVSHSGSTNSSMALVPQDTSRSTFDPSDTKMDLVWMDATMAYGYMAVAILQDPGTSKRYMVRFNFEGASYNKIHIVDFKPVDDAPGMDKMTRFVVDNYYGYLVYESEGKLYRMNLDTGITILIKDYGANMRISMLKKSPNISYTNWSSISSRPNNFNLPQLEPVALGIMAGVYDPANPDASGIVDVIKIPNTTQLADSYYTLTGFGKVVDAVYINN
ncbi:hypothetical protein COR50_11625 [Chitinophaga caeni]|uniref:PKD-like family protein n=1 Tax=Chitinophaga caeni TaxID=2029983 RepID=A0A291QUY3_9BACT|nr:PKD-like family lipoprotein [Chitinophaga caeni]ATL47760.1 hypothetical protein COR50_11625 [Chitinophaga caeni]